MKQIQEQIYKNNLYEDLREYVKVNHGFSSELGETDLYKEYLKQKEFIKNNFSDRKVKISYSYTANFMGGEVVCLMI